MLADKVILFAPEKVKVTNSQEPAIVVASTASDTANAAPVGRLEVP